MRKLILFSLCFLLCAVSFADPVMVTTEYDPLQDFWALDGWVEELSTAPHDMENQLISSQMVPWGGHIPCPTDFQNSAVQVSITNLTNRFFEDLYYVGDVHDNGTPETTFTNLDEWVADITPGNPFNVPGMAFKIDAIGLNTPLVFESMTPDQIFEPGETWEFVVQDYWNMLGNPASALASVGQPPYGAIAQASMLDSISAASIITPEPTTIGLLSLGALLLRKRKS